MFLQKLLPPKNLSNFWIANSKPEHEKYLVLPTIQVTNNYLPNESLIHSLISYKSVFCDIVIFCFCFCFCCFYVCKKRCVILSILLIKPLLFVLYDQKQKKNENFVRVLLVHCFGIDYPRLIMIA